MASYGTYKDFYLTVRNKKKNSERMTSPPKQQQQPPSSMAFAITQKGNYEVYRKL